MTPYRRVVDVASQQPGNGRRGAELDFFAAVVAASQAGFAFAADDVGFDGDAVADTVGGDGGVGGDDDAGGLVAEDVRVGYDHGTDAAGVPEVDVRAGRVWMSVIGEHARAEWCVWAETAYPHMPVLLMAMVTSPGWRLSPLVASCWVGTASATQRSWAGFVYTPMLGLEGFTVVVVVVVDIVRVCGREWIGCGIVEGESESESSCRDWKIEENCRCTHLPYLNSHQHYYTRDGASSSQVASCRHTWRSLFFDGNVGFGG